jgi:hypothetical protein
VTDDNIDDDVLLPVHAGQVPGPRVQSKQTLNDRRPKRRNPGHTHAKIHEARIIQQEAVHRAFCVPRELYAAQTPLECVANGWFEQFRTVAKSPEYLSEGDNAV